MARKSIRKTFTIISALMVALVMVALTIFMSIVRNVLQDNAQGYLRMTHQQIRDNVEACLQDIEHIALSMCYSPSVQNFLLTEDPVERLRLFSEVQSVFSNLYYMDYAIACFSLYNQQGELLAANGSSYAGITLQSHLDTVSGPVYATEYPSNAYIGKTYNAYTLTLPVLEQRYQAPTNRVIGYIVFTVETAYIRELVSAASALVTITDDSGRLLASSAASEEDFRHVEVFQTSVFDTVDWTLTTYGQSEMITGEMLPIFRITLVTALLIALLLTGFFWLISRKFLSPITKISQFMRDVAFKADTPQYSPEPEQYAELRTMTDAMNHMLRALEQKREELLLQEKRTHEAELANDRLEILAYRSQINPHFLYNTLECISGMAMMYHADGIDQISQSLSNMFRYAIKGGDRVTVEEEVAHMKEYATIIHYRFMGRIVIDFHVSEDALSVMIPRLVLQPILENSVFHGLERKPGKGQIQVEVFTQAGMLMMRVQDNGLGMQAEQLQELLRRVDVTRLSPDDMAQDKKGIGLWNIARRLYLFYQDRARLTFESVPQQGTRVEIQLPV